MEQSKEVATIAGAGAFVFTPQTLKEAKEYAATVANSGLCPAAYKGKPDDVLIAWQMGGELGLKAMQALQSIAVINGKPTLYGDGFLAVVQSSPDFEWIEETDDGQQATCKIKRKGMPVTVRTFSVEDAKTAGLSGKSGPWMSYPKRMRQMRARGFCGRDAFADRLKGIIIAEEAQDYEVVQTLSPGVEIVAPRRASEACPVPSTLPAEPTATETPVAVDVFIPTRVTKRHDGTFAVYNGDAVYLTAVADIAALAKTAKENGHKVRVRYVGDDALTIRELAISEPEGAAA